MISKLVLLCHIVFWCVLDVLLFLMVLQYNFSLHCTIMLVFHHISDDFHSDGSLRCAHAAIVFLSLEAIGFHRA